MSIETKHFETEREKYFYLQGELTALRIVENGVRKDGTWIQKLYTLPILDAARKVVVELYNDHFPEDKIE